MNPLSQTRKRRCSVGAIIGGRDRCNRGGKPPKVKRSTRPPEGQWSNTRAAELQPDDVAPEDEPKPEPLTPAEQRLKDITEQIEADPMLIGRPAVRKLCLDLGTKPLRGKLGRPAKINGVEVDTPAEDLIRDAVVSACVNPNHPKQYEMCAMVWRYRYGEPRKSLEVSGPNGGPIQQENIGATLSPEEMAARFVRAARIAQEVLEQGKGRAVEVEAIEVGAKSESAAVSTEPATIVPAPAPPPFITQSIPAVTGQLTPVTRQPSGPVVGMIPIGKP